MKRRTKRIAAILSSIAIVALIWLAQPNSRQNQTSADAAGEATPRGVKTSAYAELKLERESRAIKRQLSDEAAIAEGLPRGTFAYVFDRAPNKNRFLLARSHDSKFLPDSEAPSGMDLWLQDDAGNERLLNESVTRAKFSPDGNKVAFTTSDCVLHVEGTDGTKIGEVQGVYGQNWRPDGNAVVFSKVGEGQDPHRPGTRQLTSFDLATGLQRPLTDGQFDDGCPQFNPTSEWVIFVSGARSGLASFWQVPVGGGEPIQLTNTGLDHVDERFVPTPYDRTLWSNDKRWFVYDFKSGDRQETWGLEFNANGTMKQASKLADGINPRWKEDGRTFVCERQVDGRTETIISSLP